MKVLMIYLNSGSRRFLPIGLSTLIPYLRQKGHDVSLFDTSFYKEYSFHNAVGKKESMGIYKKVKNPMSIKFNNTSLYEDLMDLAAGFKAQIFGISCLSSIESPTASKISEMLKANFPSIPIIMGGIHPTVAPEEVIGNKNIDMICLGEGELAMAQLCDRLDTGGNITNIPNIWLKDNGKIIKNPTNSFIDMEKLPLPDWSCFSDQHFYGPLDGRMYRMGSVTFSRGCPFACSYCINDLLQKDYYENFNTLKGYNRRKSIDKCIHELSFLKKKHKIEMFYVVDESFLSMNTDDLSRLSKLYKREVNTPFFVQTAPQSVSEDKVKLLKEMGVYLVTIGIENGNPELRRNVLKRRVSDKAIINAFHLFNKYNIRASSFNMVGLPFETRSDFFKTVRLNRICKPTTLGASIFTPYKGTELRKIAIDNGFLKDTQKDFYPTDHSLLNMPDFKPQEIRGLYKTFALYCRFPKILFPLIRLAEKENKYSLFIYRILLKLNKLKENTQTRRINLAE